MGLVPASQLLLVRLQIVVRSWLMLTQSRGKLSSWFRWVSGVGRPFGAFDRNADYRQSAGARRNRLCDPDERAQIDAITIPGSRPTMNGAAGCTRFQPIVHDGPLVVELGFASGLHDHVVVADRPDEIRASACRTGTHCWDARSRILAGNSDTAVADTVLDNPRRQTTVAQVPLEQPTPGMQHEF